MAEPERRTLLCPTCGAPLPPAASHETVTCAFCGATSVPAPASGVRLATRPATPSSCVCPRCELPLFEADAGGVVLLGCGTCGGIWLDNASARRAVATFNARVVELADRASTHARTAPNRAPRGRCATCRSLLTRTTVTRAQVEVDVCAEHGTWFDSGELEVVLDAMRAAKAAPPIMDAPLRPDEIPNFRARGSLDPVDAGLIAGGVLTVLGALVAAAGSD